MEVRGQLSGFGSLLPLWVLGLNYQTLMASPFTLGDTSLALLKYIENVQVNDFY